MTATGLNQVQIGCIKGPVGTMYIVPYVHRVSTIGDKIVHTIRILLEGDRLWSEDAPEAALEENGFVSKITRTKLVEGHQCFFADIDSNKTDLASMYSAEELDPADKDTHRWCQFHLITTASGAFWLPPPADLVFAPLSARSLFVRILKPCDVDYLNGDYET